MKRFPVVDVSSDGSVIILVGGVETTITRRGTGYIVNGTPRDKFQLFGQLGVSCDWLDGILDCAAVIGERTPALREYQRACKELPQLHRSAEKAKRIHAFWNTTRKSVRRQAEKSADMKARQRAMFEAFRRTCDQLNMPRVPCERHLISQLFSRPRFSGVYFIWNDLLCDYVGKSINVPIRLKTHSTFYPGSMVSFIELPPADIGRAENFYVWLLNPRHNTSLDESARPSRRRSVATMHTL